ncbi:hypothetical protein [Streptomyces sp. CB01881]|nr:hypothetical protein [Streptomyces sp. CB01881]
MYLDSGRQAVPLRQVVVLAVSGLPRRVAVPLRPCCFPKPAVCTPWLSW